MVQCPPTGSFTTDVLFFQNTEPCTGATSVCLWGGTHLTAPPWEPPWSLGQKADPTPQPSAQQEGGRSRAVPHRELLSVVAAWGADVSTEGMGRDSAEARGQAGRASQRPGRGREGLSGGLSDSPGSCHGRNLRAQ